jgi:excisionase family DNA binding protein
MSPTERPTLSVAETAELLGISRWLVQQAVRDGSIPSLRVGRRILIPRARLLSWLGGDGPSAAAYVPGGNPADRRVARAL